MKSYQGYSFYRYQEVEEKWLLPLLQNNKDDLPSSAPAVDTLCWVLQSKGKKRGRKGQLVHKQNTDQEDGDDADDSQRKQLFNRAWVMEQPKEDIPTTTTKTKKMKDRILVHYPKGSTYHVKKENLLPVLTQEAVVIVLPETRIYRRWCVVHTQPQDRFCEIGCDVGILVNRIREWSSCPEYISGMDKSSTSIAEAKRRYPDCKFVEWSVPLEDEQQPNGSSEEKDNTHNQKAQKNSNGSKEESKQEGDVTKKDESKSTIQQQLQQQQQTTPLPMDLFPPSPITKDEQIMNKSLVVAIDINGNRGLKAVQQCVEIVIQEWKPRLIIVKSRALYQDLNS